MTSHDRTERRSGPRRNVTAARTPVCLTGPPVWASRNGTPPSIPPPPRICQPAACTYAKYGTPGTAHPHVLRQSPTLWQCMRSLSAIHSAALLNPERLVSRQLARDMRYRSTNTSRNSAMAAARWAASAPARWSSWSMCLAHKGDAKHVLPAAILRFMDCALCCALCGEDTLLRSESHR